MREKYRTFYSITFTYKLPIDMWKYKHVTSIQNMTNDWTMISTHLLKNTLSWVRSAQSQMASPHSFSDGFI